MATKAWLAYCKMIRGGKETRSRMARNRKRNNVKKLLEEATKNG